MNLPTPPYQPYRQMALSQTFNQLRETEVPTGYSVSLGLPTQRWHGPGFAYFAAPAIRHPGEPRVHQAPDRWWVVNARTGHLIAYALAVAVPFHDGAAWQSVTLPPSAVTIERQRANLEKLATLIDRLAPYFFQGTALPQEERKPLRDVLAELIPESLLPRHRALVPDFFTWLNA